MKTGIIGLGKMGLPIATAMDFGGHDVMGYDLNPARMSLDPQPYRETGPDGRSDFNKWLAASTVKFGSMEEVVDHADILFVMTQTPHDPEFEGLTRLPADRVDFDYQYLREAVRQIVDVVKEPTVLVVVSTVLPGTLSRELKPIIEPVKDTLALVYNPSFIAMGTTMKDFLYPEFILVGQENVDEAETLKTFYSSFIDAPLMTMSIESAELSKVAYNTFIGEKIIFANQVMEICDRMAGADCDEVAGALKNAKRRLISTAYLDGGMGDGGGCHPRDNIAMSYLAQKLGLKYDLFESVMLCREGQTDYLASMAVGYAKAMDLPVVILGQAFKPHTNLTIGSPAILLGNLIKEKGVAVQYADNDVGTALKESDVLQSPAVFVIGCKHDRYANAVFPKGSWVIDPHRMIPPQAGVHIEGIGSKVRANPVKG